MAIGEDVADLSFYVPIELLVPTRPDDKPCVEDFHRSLLEICEARNNSDSVRPRSYYQFDSSAGEWVSSKHFWYMASGLCERFVGSVVVWKLITFTFRSGSGMSVWLPFVTMHMKFRTLSVATATVLICCLIPFIGVALRDSATVTARETTILQTLAMGPESLRDFSAICAYLFSTVGCIVLVGFLAALDMRITSNRKIVVRDVIVSAAPIVYITGIKWLVVRPRPITSVGSGLLPGDPSFPSGHTAAAVIVSVMMLLTVRNLAHKRFSEAEVDRRQVFSRRATVGAVALVVVVACSRLLLGLHYPTDVIISAIVCPLISYTIWCVWDGIDA